MLIYTIGDIVNAVVVAVMLAAAIIISIIRYAKQRACLHEEYYEDMACNAICRTCGKNLGFIANVRNSRKQSRKG